MPKNLKHLQPYTDADLVRIRQEARDMISGGKIIGRVDPYFKVIREIDRELEIRNPPKIHPWRAFGTLRKSQQEGGSVQW